MVPTFTYRIYRILDTVQDSLTSLQKVKHCRTLVPSSVNPGFMAVGDGGICIWNKMSMGIYRSRPSTCSVRPRKASNVMLSFSVRVQIVAHTSSLILLRVISMSARKVDCHRL